MEKIRDYIRQLDNETASHMISVGNYCSVAAERLVLDKDIFSKAGYYHDVGKIYIPDRILLKPGPLNKDEREVVNRHAYYSYKILKKLGIDDFICQVILYHHGTDKMKPNNMEPPTTEVLRYAKALHTIDYFDALTTQRCYHEALEKEYVLSNMAQNVEFSQDIVMVLKNSS